MEDKKVDWTAVSVDYITGGLSYRALAEKFDMQIVASGGVSSLDDVKRLSELDIYGAIIGKAYYTGAIKLRDAIEVAK